MTAAQITLLVVAILLAQLAIWVPAILWLRRRIARVGDELRAELEGEGEIVLGPHAAIYRGSTGGFSKVKGNGVIALTPTRLVIAKIIGDRVELPLDEITGVRTAKWFARSARGNRVHVVVEASEDRALAFMVEQTRAWVDALSDQVGLDEVDDAEAAAREADP